MTRGVLVCALLLAACKQEGEVADETIEAKGSARAGSAGGFSAALSAELGGSAAGSGSGAAPAAGSGSDAAAGSAAGSAAMPASGSAATPATAAGSGAGSAAAGSAASGSTTTAAGSTTAAAGSAATKPATTPPATTPPATTPPATTAGAGSAATKPATTPPATTPPASGTAAVANTPVLPAPPPQPAVVPAALKAIKLSLLPNWDRDLIEPGTISLVVKMPDSGGTHEFVFGYGYDEPNAPIDRDAYKKFLADSKLLKVTMDRQRGAAWYLEGTDVDGTPAFRYLVTYGGKRLVCYGSLYKNSPIGDYRDEVIIQAKKICETLAL